MFVIDGSASVQLHNFNKVKNWTKQVVNGFELAGNDQVGLVRLFEYTLR